MVSSNDTTPGDEPLDAEARAPASVDQNSSPIVDKNLIKELAALLTETALTEIEVDTNGLRLRVVRAPAAQSVGFAAPAAMPAVSGDGSASTVSASADQAHPGAVTSPMVGTAYLSPEPDAAPFVLEGDQVREGQTLLIVEAMKTMNPILAHKAGTVSRILVSDSQPVEYGEPLLLIE